jgi:hypothetical protein
MELKAPRVVDATDNHLLSSSLLLPFATVSSKGASRFTSPRESFIHGFCRLIVLIGDCGSACNHPTIHTSTSATPHLQHQTINGFLKPAAMAPSHLSRPIRRHPHYSAIQKYPAIMASTPPVTQLTPPGTFSNLEDASNRRSQPTRPKRAWMALLALTLSQFDREIRGSVLHQSNHACLPSACLLQTCAFRAVLAAPSRLFAPLPRTIICHLVRHLCLPRSLVQIPHWSLQQGSPAANSDGDAFLLLCPKVGATPVWGSIWPYD